MKNTVKKYLSEIGKKSHPNGGTEAQKKASRANGKNGGRPKNNWVEKIFTDYPLTAKNTLENLSNGEFDWEKLSESDKQIHAKQAYEILSESE